MEQRSRPEIRQNGARRRAVDGTAASDSAFVIGEMFRASREALGLSQSRVSDLTAEIGAVVSRSAICDIERGCNMPGIESLVSLCEVLQLDPHEILERIALHPKLAGEQANGSFEQLKHRAGLLRQNCQYRAATVLCTAMLERLGPERSTEPLDVRTERVRTEHLRAICLRRSGRTQAAEGAIRRSIRLAAGLEARQTLGFITLARIHLDEGLFHLAKAEIDQAIRMADATDYPRVRALAVTTLGFYLYHTGRIDESAEAHIRARGFSIESGDLDIQAGIEGSLGTSLMDLGHPMAARRQYARGVQLARKAGDPSGELCWTIEAGWLALSLDAPDEAEQCAAAALRIARNGDNPLSLFRGLWLQHKIERRRNSRKPDRQRIAHLNRLYPRVAAQNGIDVVREFRREILGRSDA
jgi:tetratricopeptide (TPR) repeat protein